MPLMLPGKPERGGGPQDTCPRRLIFEDPAEFWEAMHLYTQYDKGNLALSGGLLEQPQPYLDLMRIIGSAVSEVEHELTERARKT